MMASYYMHLLRVCERAIQDLRKQGHNPQIRALVWMNGHRDAWEFSKAMSYQKAHDKLMDMWREDFGFNMPIIVTQSSFMGHRKPASFKNIMESKVKAVKKDFFSEIIPTKDLSHRSHHELSKQGHEVLGMRMSYALSPMLQASMKYMPKQLAATKERSAEPKPEKEQKPTKREFFQEDFQLNDFPDLEVY